MVDAVLSVAVDPSGVEQGARVVRRSLEDIDRSANSSMSAMDRYNAHLGKGASAAEIYQRQMKAMEAQVKAADDAFRAQSRAVEELNFRFDIVRSAAKDVVAGLQQIGKTKFTGDIVADINRLSTDMARIMDAGGKGAVTAARAAQKEMLAYARAHLDQQLALVKEEAQKRIAGAQAEWARIKELHKGAKTEIAAQERAAAEQALEIATKAATDSVAAAKSASAGIIADMETRSNQLITIKKEENRVAADLVRADEQLKRTTTELDGSLNRLLATEQQHNAMLVATEASEKRLNDLAGQVVEREKKKSAAIDATTTSLKEQMALQIPNGYAPVSNAGLASSYILAPPSPPTPPSPPPEDPEEIERLLAVRQKLLASYDWETLALDRRDDALEKLSLLRQKNIIDDDAEYERLRRRISGEEEAARQQAQAAERAAVENDRLAASYKSVMASIDPAVAAQQRYDSALATLRAGAAATGRSAEELAADEAALAATLSPPALAAQRQAVALQTLEDRLDKVGATARQAAADQALLDKALTEQRISPERHAALSQTLREQSGATETAARSTKLAAHEVTNLSYQIQDLGVQLVSGQSPFMAIAQQGPQAVMAVGGLNRAMALLASPITLAVLGASAFVGVMALVAARAVEINTQTRELTATMRAYGTEAQATAGNLRDVANALYEGGVGRSESYAVAKVLASTRGVSAGMGQELALLGSDMAVGLNQSVDETVKQLTALTSEGYPAIMKLQEAIGFLTAEEVKSIRTMAEHGQQSDALTVAIGALHRRFDGLRNDSMSPAGAAMHQLGVGWNAFIDAVANSKPVMDAISGLSGAVVRMANAVSSTPHQQVASLQRDLDELYRRRDARDAAKASGKAYIGIFSIWDLFGATDGSDLDRQIKDVEGRLASARKSILQTVSAAARPGVPAHRAANDLPADTVSQKAADYVNEQAHAYDRLSQSMQGNAVQRQLAAAAMRAEDEIRDRNLKGKQAEELQDIRRKEALLQLKVAVDDTNRTAAAEVAGAELVAHAYGASSAAVREATIHQKALAEVARGTIEPYDAIVARLRVLDDAQRRVNAAQADFDLRNQIDAARRLAQAETESGAAIAEANIQNKIRAQILKEGVDLDSARAQAIEAGTRALEAQNAAARVNSSIRQGNQDLALVRAEYDMLGMSNAERERSVAIMRAQLEVQNSGDWAQVPQETRDAWIAQAGAVAEYRSRVADATEASRDFANVIGKGFEDAVLAGGKLSDILKGLQSDIERIFLRATVTKPLETWLSGTATKALAPAPANDNLVQPVNDNDPGGYRSLFEGLTSGRTGAIGSQGNPMWVRFASAGGAALDLNSFATQASSGPVPVAVKDAGDLEGVIQTASAKYGVDANLIKAVIQKESTWNPNALNGSGAAGLMQVMPANWRAYGITNPYDPAQNIEAGTKILREKLDQAGGDLAAALSAYSGHVKSDGTAYVKAVMANKAAYDQAGASTVALAGAQTQAAAAASVFTSEQRKVIDAALGSQRATAEATDQQDALTDGLGHFRESLEAEVNSRDQAVRATQQLTQAQQTAAAGMVGGTQAALGGIMSLLGGITGAGTVSVGGSVISAGGPQGIQSALGSLWNGISGGSFANTSLSGIKTWLNSTAWGGNVASKTAPVAKAGNGTLAGGEGAQTGMGTAPATPAVTWGNVVGGGMTAVGGALQMSRAQNAGQSIGGAAQMAGGVMMMIPGMQVAGGLVALGGTLLSAFSDGNSRGDPYSVTNLSMKGGRFTRGSFDADNGGDPAKWNSAVDQVATKLNSLMDTYGLVAGKLTNVAVGERNASPEQAMLQALRSMKSDNADVAWVLANAVGDDLDAAVKAIDFASKWRDTITLWNSGMDSIVAATQQGTAAANAFGKTVLQFLDGAAATYDVAALTAKAGGKTGNAALDKLLAGLPGYATGTPSAKSGWAVVGEEGPELVKLSGGERIWNARESARMVAGLGQGRDTELVHVRPDELAWMHKTLGGGRTNPATGLPMFLEGETGGSSDNGSGGVGGMGGSSDGYGGHTDRDGGFTASENSGGMGGFISTLSSAISDLSRSVANALGMDAKETAVLGGMVGITGTVAIGGIRGFAEAVGKGIASVTGPGEAPAVAGPGDPGLSPTGGDFAAAEAVLTKLLDAIKDDPSGAVGSSVMGGLEAGATGYTVAQIAGGSSDAYLAGVRGQGGEAKVAALAEDLDAAVQSIAEAGVAIPDVLRQALEKTNAYAKQLGVTPASEKREATERLFNEKLGEQGLSTGRYGEVMGVVQSLADGTFSAVGKDFQALADDMVKSMAAMSFAGMQVPAALAAAEKRMLALVAAKARIDAEIAGIKDTSSDYQKQVAQLTGYWSAASTDLVKAMQAVGYEGDTLTAKLGEGLKNALKRLNEETAKVYTSDLNAASGKDYLNQLTAIREWFDKNGMDVNHATGDDGAANRMYGARADSVLKGLSIDQLNTVIASSNDNTMQAWAQTYLGKARATFAEDNGLRQLRAKVDLGVATEEAYNKEALRIEQMRELAEVTDEAQRAALKQTHALEEQVATMKAVTAAGKTIVEWMDAKRGTAGATVSATAAYTAANDTHQRDLALAAANDNDALGRVTGNADRLIEAYTRLNGSSGATAYQEKILAEVAKLPAAQSYQAILAGKLDAVTGAIQGNGQSQALRDQAALFAANAAASESTRTADQVAASNGMLDAINANTNTQANGSFQIVTGITILGQIMATGLQGVMNAIVALPHAAGGPAAGLTMINDAGPEIVRLPTGSHVMTSRASVDFLRRGLGGGGGGTTTVVSDNREVVAELKQIVRATLVTSNDLLEELRRVTAVNAQQKKELERLRRTDRQAADGRTQPGRRAG
ncbi:transglycosylase SLT domain-containing protein [Azospirillum aestuarii]|uniref:transglycosylase SLT domain-containing protein n=1 Tax=Azospirillum aestuarii TaxID=2802052 RepID=UPI004054D82D